MKIKLLVLLSLILLTTFVSINSFAQAVQVRSDAFYMNEKLGNGIVFGSIMWTFENNERYDLRDFELARENDFNHARICARMQNMQDSTGVISAQAMNQLVAIIDDALTNDLIAVICPFFWWKGGNGEPPAFSNSDIPALADMWEQIALRCLSEGYSLEDVVFELYEEPESGIDVDLLIEACVNKIKAVENRYIIIPGRGFKTIEGLGRVFDEDNIPLDYDRLIGTFHFYEPKCEFCNLYQTACGVTEEPSEYISWPNATYNEEALRSWFVKLDQQNANWALRNGTVKIPVYMGEYGTLNKPNAGNSGKMDLPREERKHWVWWTRTVAEEFGYSTAYWNAYGNTSFGLGNWSRNNPDDRNMADPDDSKDEEFIRHSLLGRYESEDLKSVASINEFTIGSDSQTSHDYLSFLNTASNQKLTFDDVYVGVDGVYNLTIRFSNAHNTELNLNIQSQQYATPMTNLTDVPFTNTGISNWYTKTIPIELKAGINSIELSGTINDLRLDFIAITHENETFLDQRYNAIASDDRNGSNLTLDLIENPDFEEGYATYWTLGVFGSAQANYSDAGPDAANGSSAAKVQVTQADNFYRVVLKNIVSTYDFSRKILNISCSAKGLNDNLSFKMRMVSTINDTPSYSPSEEFVLLNDEFSTYTFTYEVPDNVESLQFGIICGNTEGTYIFDDFFVSEETSLGVGLSQTAEDKIKIYPNPTKGKIYAETNTDIHLLQLFNIYGKVLVSAKHQNVINIDLLENGVYILKIKLTDGNIMVKKVVKN